jgi:hypothetical protein
MSAFHDLVNRVLRAVYADADEVEAGAEYGRDDGPVGGVMPGGEHVLAVAANGLRHRES